MKNVNFKIIFVLKESNSNKTIRLIQKQTDRIAELEEDNNIYAEEVITNISKAKNIKANHGSGFLLIIILNLEISCSGSGTGEKQHSQQ